VFSGEGETEGDLHGCLSLDQHDFVCAVSDGMGGANAGERASELVVGELRRAIPSAFRAAATGMTPDYLGLLESAVQAVHAAINGEAEREPARSGMGATLSLCWFTPGQLWFVHVGDSRIYRFRDGVLRQFSEDHSRVGHLFRRGLLNERQARSHPRRHVLQQALGAGIAKIEPQLGVAHLRPGDRFLICTDGLVDGLWNRGIAEALGAAGVGGEALGRACAGMLWESLEAGGRDNTTLVLVEIEASGADSVIDAR
jgi:protein phosphatase